VNGRVYYDVAEFVDDFNLPALPDEVDENTDPEARILILFMRDADNVVLTNPVSFDDANEYTNREDTHGEGWFVGRDRPNDYEPGEVY
jgi:hypothetical protein